MGFPFVYIRELPTPIINNIQWQSSRSIRFALTLGIVTYTLTKQRALMTATLARTGRRAARLLLRQMSILLVLCGLIDFTYTLNCHYVKVFIAFVRS